MSFIPISREEVLKRGWDELDVIFVSGDAYIDHPSFGVPLLARWLESRGFRVGIIAQPDWRSKDAFTLLGRPRLFFAVSAGAMDSMVAHYTPARKLRHDDAYTPGNRHGARPNRATIVYTSRLKEAYKDVPVVIGGIEASLRRFAHYDFWEDKVRRSILFDSKGDLLIFGMAESPILELSRRLKAGEPFEEISDIKGTAFIVRGGSDTNFCIELPSYEAVSADRLKYAEAFRLMAEEQNPYCARPLVQRHGDRMLYCNPPSFPLSEQEMDSVYSLPFVKAPHPSYKEQVPAYEQIKESVTTHRGCFGGCAFCAIGHHQGKVIQSRSVASIIREIELMSRQRWFRGSISDLGGPTANMYGLRCNDPSHEAACRKGSCLYPKLCRNLVVDDHRGAGLLDRALKIAGVKSVAVSSGVRFDLLERQPNYFSRLVARHAGGLLKVAPEHSVDRVLTFMRKPGGKAFEIFLDQFRKESTRLGKRQAVVPYLISGHPGCTLDDMVELALFLKRKRLRVEQVQDFTPTPGTLATCMYHTGIDPYTGEKVYVPRSDREKRLQKSLLFSHIPSERRYILEALRSCGREKVANELLPAPSRRGA